MEIHPRPAVLAVGTAFHSTSQQMVRESYTETKRENCGTKSERYACGTQTSGYGSYKRTSTRYCNRMVTNYCNRTKQKYRNVMRTVRVPKGSCTKKLKLMPGPGDILVVELAYYERGRCRLKCYRQFPQAEGKFKMIPCN